MAHTAKIREVKNVLLERFGPNCWMGYWVGNKNSFTYHHINERRKGGKETIENGAILTVGAHRDLNELDSHVKKLYHHLNALFIELNKTNKPPTIEYYKELYSLLQEAKKHIELDERCMLLRCGFDFGLLNEMILKAEEMDNKKGHIELIEEYSQGIIEKPIYTKTEGYIKIDGIFLPASFEDNQIFNDSNSSDETIEYTYSGYMQIKGVFVPISYLITESRKKITATNKKRKEIKEKMKVQQPLSINEEYKKILRHKNRDSKLYKFN